MLHIYYYVLHRRQHQTCDEYVLFLCPCLYALRIMLNSKYEYLLICAVYVHIHMHMYKHMLYNVCESLHIV